MSGTDAKRQLVVLGCSATKVDAAGTLPAVTLYDGPMYRVLRSYLRERRWPTSLSLAVLSAKYGLIGGLSHIETYDQRMSQNQPGELFRQSKLTETPDHENGRAFSYPVAHKGLRRTRPHGPRSVFQTASTCGGEPMRSPPHAESNAPNSLTLQLPTRSSRTLPPFRTFAG